jgi:hypothetical protein
MNSNSDASGSSLGFRLIVCLFALALVPRLLLLGFGPWQDTDRAKRDDSNRYLQLAENLREHHTFGLRGPGGLVHQSVVRLRAANSTLPPADSNGLRPESFRTPGYPAFIGLIELLGGGIRAVLLIQCLLGAALPCFAASIGRSLGLSVRGSFLIGLLWAIHPGLIVFDGSLLTESLFNAVVLTGLFLACRVRSLWGVLGAGLLLGLATLVRPLGYLYVPAALTLAWPRLWSKWIGMLILTLATGLPPVLWAFRNQAVDEGFRVTTVGDLNILYYTAAYCISEERREDWLQSWPVRVEGLTNRLGRRLHQGEDVVIAARRLAWDEIRSRPGSVVKVQAKSWFKLFLDHSMDTLAGTLGLPYQPSGLFSALVLDRNPAPKREQGSIAMRIGAVAWMILNALIVLAALVGANRAIHDRQWRHLIFGVLTILLFTLATGSVGLERFRMPMMLPLFVLAANCIPFKEQATVIRKDLSRPEQR